jgi:DDE family transposase
MRVAYRLALACLPDYSCEYSRHDFTLPQLFACLVLREHQKKSYRGVEALLEDSPCWRAEIGLSRTPDHNTLCRAFGRLLSAGVIHCMLDQTTQWAKDRKLLKGKCKPLSLDSSLFESRHVSRHFEHRQRQSARDGRKKRGKTSEKTAGDRRRSRVIRGLPKLSLATDSGCHLILAARATTGGGADQPHFSPLLFDAWRRADVKGLVADAGYDSESNHCIARSDMRVRSIIPPNAGRPTDKLPTGRHRRNMHHRFKRKADRKLYGQRWQSETVNSMIKRNLGSALRATSSRRRSKELLLRVITHNVMILSWN